MTTVVEAALSYAAKGWPVLPVYGVGDVGNCDCGNLLCREVAKHPLLSQSRYKEATKNAGTVIVWWELHPLANVSIATGSRSGIVVLDIDVKKDGPTSLRFMERNHGSLPPTVRAKTGSGGEHIFFQAPTRELRGRIGMRPGVDVRAEDQNCIMPPSRHKSGMPYAWKEGMSPDDIAIAPLPRWLDLMARQKQVSTRRRVKHASLNYFR